jgi:hypothetical protein
MLSLAAAIGYGGVGGSVTEAVILYGRLGAWQQACHAAIAKGAAKPLFTSFIDPKPDAAVAVTRVVLGCLAGWLLHGQVGGMYAALTVGASAPALLASLGKATSLSGVLQRKDDHEADWLPEPTWSAPLESRREAAE